MAGPGELFELFERRVRTLDWGKLILDRIVDCCSLREWTNLWEIDTRPAVSQPDRQTSTSRRMLDRPSRCRSLRRLVWLLIRFSCFAKAPILGRFFGCQSGLVRLAVTRRERPWSAVQVELFLKNNKTDFRNFPQFRWILCYVWGVLLERNYDSTLRVRIRRVTEPILNLNLTFRPASWRKHVILFCLPDYSTRKR